MCLWHLMFCADKKSLGDKENEVCVIKKGIMKALA
jgi:hypothetical protein